MARCLAGPEPAPRLRSDAARNRRRILAAASELFAESGADLSVEEIARRAGVGNATVFRRFPTKEDLVVAMFEARLLEGATRRRGGRGRDPWEGLRTAMEHIAAKQVRDRGLFEAVGTEVIGDEHLHARHVELMGRLEAIVETAKTAGVLREDVAATDLPMLAAGAASTCQTAGGDAPELWRRYLGIMLDGLRPARRRRCRSGRARSRRSSRPRPAVSDRAERVLERIRDIPPGFVRTYGDVSPGAPRFAGTVLGETEIPTSRGSASCAPTARWPRARASARCSTPRACRSAATASTSPWHDCRT